MPAPSLCLGLGASCSGEEEKGREGKQRKGLKGSMAAMAEGQSRGGAGGGRPLPPPPQQRGLPGPPPRPRFEPVDREKTCPLLLRVFTKIGTHHTKEDFAVRGKEPKDEVQIYTWKDATLRELTDLIGDYLDVAIL
ncbi:Histone deacetylase complex subunit [Nymphaea thermarum]|nr:Histone deacetylase complex subunit [Nymphaea thermarum]